MSVGRITVDLLAKTGSFETDMARAAKTAERRAKEIDAVVTKAGAAVGIALSAAGIAAVHFGKQLIDGLDALNDVKDATGASIASLSALEDVAVRTGTNMDNVSSILVKFNNALKEADGKNAASQALKALGLSAEELKQIDPAEALRLTAVALAGFADDGNKARLVQELFGKSIKDAAPFLKDLAEQTALVGKVTDQQAQAAEDFNKQLFALQKNAVDAGRALLSDLLPAMNRFLQNAREISNLGGFGLIVKDAAKGMVGMGRMTGDNGADIKKLMQERDQLQAAMDAEKRPLVRANDSRAGDIAEINRYLQILRAKQRNDIASTFGDDMGDAVSRKFNKPAPSLPSISAGGGKTAKSPKDRETEFEKYLENLQKQLDKTKELTVAETVLAHIAGGRLKLQKGESADVLVAVAKQIDAAKSLKDYNELAAAAEKAKDAALLESTTAQEAKTQGLADGNRQLREEIEVIGKSIEAQAAIEAARLSSAIAVAEQYLAYKESTGALERETDAMKSQIELLMERQDLLGQKGVAEQLKKDADEANKSASAIGDAFAASFERAIMQAGNLNDVLKNLGKSILATVLRESIVDPISKSIKAAFSSGGSGSGSSGGNSGGGFISAIAGLFGGFFGGAKATGGPVSSTKAYLVGEQGPEIFKPNTSGTIIPNGATGGGGSVNYYNFTVGDVATVSMVKSAIATSQRQVAGTLDRSQRYGGRMAA